MKGGCPSGLLKAFKEVALILAKKVSKAIANVSTIMFWSPSLLGIPYPLVS